MCRNSRQVAQCAPTAVILYYLQFLYAQHVIVTWPALARSRRCSLFRMLTAIRRGTSITVYSAVYFSLFYRSLFTFARTMVRYTFSLESSLKTDALCYRWCDFLCWMEKLEGITCSFIGIQVLISFPTFFPFFAGLVSKADQAEWGWPKWLSLPSALKWLGYGRRKGCHKEVIYFLQLQRSVGVHVSSSTTSWAAQPSSWVVQCVQSCGSHSKHTRMSGSIAEGHHYGHFYGQYNYKMNLHVETLILL